MSALLTHGLPRHMRSFQRRITVLVACIVAGVAPLAVVALPSVASASFPGGNGRFAVELDGCEGISFIRLFSRTGRALGAVTPRCRYVGDSEEHAVALYDWSPDGRRLLVHQSGVHPQGVITMALDGSDQRASPVPSDAYDASFAPDGRHILYLVNGAIWRANLETGQRRKLRALQCNVDVSRDCMEFQAARWSPDGDLIAVRVASKYGLGGGRPPKVAKGIWLMSARTGKLVRRVARDGYEIDWAPDSSRLVYRSHYTEFSGAGGDIWVVKRSGGRPRRIVRRAGLAETSPVWSPDGRWLAWVSLRFGPFSVEDFYVKPSLWRMRSSGGRPRRLTGLRSPYVEEAFLVGPTPRIAWQPLATTDE